MEGATRSGQKSKPGHYTTRPANMFNSQLRTRRMCALFTAMHNCHQSTVWPAPTLLTSRLVPRALICRSRPTTSALLSSISCTGCRGYHGRARMLLCSVAVLLLSKTRGPETSRLTSISKPDNASATKKVTIVSHAAPEPLIPHLSSSAGPTKYGEATSLGTKRSEAGFR